MLFKFFTQDRSIFRQLGWHPTCQVLNMFMKSSVWNTGCFSVHRNKARFCASNIKFSFYYKPSFYLHYEAPSVASVAQLFLQLSFLLKSNYIKASLVY